MTSPLMSFVAIKFVNEGDAEPGVEALADKTFLMPPEYLAAAGSGPNQLGFIRYNEGSLVRGWHRVETDGSHTWVMTSGVNATQRAAVLAITTWVDQTMTAGTPLRIYVNVARQLLRAGVDPNAVLTALKALYDAAVANRNAQGG